MNKTTSILNVTQRPLGTPTFKLCYFESSPIVDPFFEWKRGWGKEANVHLIFQTQFDIS